MSILQTFRNYNPKKGYNTWTDFSGVKSGKAKWHWDSFHPNNYCGGDYGAFGGYPDLCYSAGSAHGDMANWMSWLRSSANAGFDSWRFDYVKGLYTWVVKNMRGWAYGIGEYWDANVSTLD